MRHLLTAILAVILFSVAFMVFANNRCDSERNGQTDSISLAESVSDEQFRYYGDTLYKFDGKTVIYDYSSGDDAEVCHAQDHRRAQVSRPGGTSACNVL